MADIKQAGFMLLVLLISVSAIYEWAQTDAVLSAQLGISELSGLDSATLIAEISGIDVSAENVIETAKRTDIVGLIWSLLLVLASGILLIMKIVFGWTGLVRAIFINVGLEELEIIFIGPIIVIQLFTITYFLRDLWNSMRGAAP